MSAPQSTLVPPTEASSPPASSTTSPPLVVAHCMHVKEDGAYCGRPALKGRRFCYGHLRLLGRRVRMLREAARRSNG